MVRDECRGEGGGRWKVKGEEGKSERWNDEEKVKCIGEKKRRLESFTRKSKGEMVMVKRKDEG